MTKRTCNKFIYICFGALILLSSVSCSDASDTKVEQATEQLILDVITDDLVHPWSLAFLPDGSFLVTERRGQLWHVDNDGTKKQINNVPDVYHEGQGGLLDIILDNDFVNNQTVYFSFAAADKNNADLANTEVARATLDLINSSLRDVEIIFTAEPKVEGGNHWGSRIVIADDNTLYVTLGERYSYKDEAQTPTNHLGTIVRINKDGSIPNDNPFVDSDDGLNSVYSFGHRNAQGLTIHPETREIWEHEHGPKGGDEINILKPGENYGWPKVTFGINYWGTKITDKTTAPGMKDPLLQWTPSIAPSGMAFYTGEKFPEWSGDLFVGALAKKHLRRIDIENGKVIKQEELLSDFNKRIRDVRSGPDGYLYILTDENNGQLIRLRPKSE